MESKHAYLIMCHNNYEQLKDLLALLDDERNDIYVHADKKWRDFPYEEIKGCVERSTLYITERIKVNWGGYSQIKTELLLLKASTPGKYTYYHLLSGEDLPIKSQDRIHRFFQENEGKEFITFDEDALAAGNFFDRVSRYYFLQEIIGKSGRFCCRVLRSIEKISLRIQEYLSVDQIKGQRSIFYKDCNWFSITHDMAEYVLSMESFIKRHFRFSFCSDELLIQTIAMNSPYKENISSFNTRLIDWARGNPYVFRSEDYDLLISSERLFARKFNNTVDGVIIQRISEYVSGIADHSCDRPLQKTSC